MLEILHKFPQLCVNEHSQAQGEIYSKNPFTLQKELVLRSIFFFCRELLAPFVEKIFVFFWKKSRYFCCWGSKIDFLEPFYFGNRIFEHSFFNLIKRLSGMKKNDFRKKIIFFYNFFFRIIKFWHFSSFYRIIWNFTCVLYKLWRSLLYA